MKRVRIVPDRPNRLFESWLEEWRNEAVLRNSELHSHFANALDSLRRYPLPLESGRECIILQHFGAKLCSMLDRKLEEHRRQESTKAVDARSSEAGSKDDRTAASREKPAREYQVVEVREKTAVAKQAKNAKKNAPKRLVNTNEIASKEASKQVSFEPNTFDIVLLVDTQETCG